MTIPNTRPSFTEELRQNPDLGRCDLPAMPRFSNRGCTCCAMKFLPALNPPELFPVDQITQDSPRLAWLKRIRALPVLTHDSGHHDAENPRWVAVLVPPSASTMVGL